MRYKTQIIAMLTIAVLLSVTAFIAMRSGSRLLTGQGIIIPVGTWGLSCENGNTPSVDSVTCLELPTETPTETPTDTPTPTDTDTPTPTPTDTQAPSSTPSETPPPAATSTPSEPFASAPLCEDTGVNHDRSQFHTLWNSSSGCHYDHEHGTNPFTSDVSETFPGFDLYELLGNVRVGHTNPSSPMENTMKHGGHKWQVDVDAPQGCLTGFEGGTFAVKGYAIQFHAFGPQDVEFESRNHSTVALLEFCKSNNPSDVGYMYAVQLQEYGQRVFPYQGGILPYPDNFLPLYDSARGPYFTTECVGNDITYQGKFIDCRTPGDITNNNLTIWTSKPTGPVSSPRPETPKLFRLLFRGRDQSQRLDITDLTHPFTWRFVCGGTTFNPIGCRFNSSTMTIHEIMGDIPAAWDGLAGFDTDPRVGRVTATGFVTGTGTLNLECTTAGGNCYPVKLVSAFVGRYSSEISVNKVSNPTPLDTPERDLYFCNSALCSETAPGAAPSGWIGVNN